MKHIVELHTKLNNEKLIAFYHINNCGVHSAIVMYANNYYEHVVSRPIIITLYLALNGRVERGIETIVLFSKEEAEEFLNGFSKSTVLEFISKASGIVPRKHQ